MVGVLEEDKMIKWKAFKLGIIRILFKWFFSEEDREFNFRFLEYKLGIATEQQYVNWMEGMVLEDMDEDRKEELALQ